MGRAPCCDKANVKKGPWSPEEDAKLKDFIEKFGTGGNWIALPQKAGLKRCGKSCRLRWLNYLRPNIKHGQFSDDEDTIICTLFATIGSRWSIIASHLPGRTDNDIKNYWNTKLKKKLMAMIPSIHGKHSQQLSNTFHTQSHSLSSHPHLYRDYNSLYFQAAAAAVTSLSTVESISAPQNSLYTNNNETFSLSTYQYPYHQEGLVGLPYYPGKENNLLIFGGNEASCSSSDGSCSQISHGKDHVKREEIGCGFHGFVKTGFDENQKLMFHYGQIHEHEVMNGFLDQKENGIMVNSQLAYTEFEEVKQLMSSCNNTCNSNSLFFNDEKKTEMREMYYY